MSEPIVKAEEPALIESGVVNSLNPLMAPLWVDGANVVFEDGMVRKSRGFTTGFTKTDSEPVRGAIALRGTDGIKRLFYGSASKLHSWDATGAPLLIRSGLTGNINETFTQKATQWSFETWGNWVVAANRKDQTLVNKSDGAGFVPLLTAPKAEIIMRRGPFLVAFNTEMGDAYAQWCDTDNIEQWSGDVEGSVASFLYIRDLDAPIIGALRLGEQIALYSDDSMVMFNFVGDPYYFGYTPGLEGIGLVSKNAGVSIKRQNYGISKSGIWVTDGVTFEYIDPPAIRLWLQENLNFDQLSKICCWWNKARNLIEWSLPINSTENSVVLSYNYQNRSWTFKPFGRTCGIDRKVFQYPIQGAADGNVYFAENGVDAADLPLISRIQSKPFDAGDPELWKYVDILQLAIHKLQGTGVRVRLGWQEFIGKDSLGNVNPINWQPWQTVNDSTAPLYFRFEGKFITFMLETTALGDDFALSGFYIYGGPGGNGNQ